MANDGVKALIDELGASDHEVEEGEFTLAEAEARAKLSELRLDEPRSYVLDLLQAAVHNEATRIDWALDADDLWLEFDGEPFTKSELGSLHSAAFRSGKTAKLRALGALALGLNASLALAPRRLSIRSGSGGSWCCWEMVPGGEERVVSEGEGEGPRWRAGPRGATQVHVKLSLPAGVGRVVDRARDRLPEAEILRTGARYCTVPVCLNGEQISHGLTIDEETLAYSGRIIDPFFRGAVGYASPRIPARLDLVTAGAFVASHPLPQAPPGFLAVIEGARLKVDLSRRDFVRDDGYARAMVLVERARQRIHAKADVARVRREALEKDIAREVARGLSAHAGRYRLFRGLKRWAFPGIFAWTGLGVAALVAWPEELSWLLGGWAGLSLLSVGLDLWSTRQASRAIDAVLLPLILEHGDGEAATAVETALAAEARSAGEGSLAAGAHRRWSRLPGRSRSG